MGECYFDRLKDLFGRPGSRERNFDFFHVHLVFFAGYFFVFLCNSHSLSVYLSILFFCLGSVPLVLLDPLFPRRFAVMFGPSPGLLVSGNSISAEWGKHELSRVLPFSKLLWFHINISFRVSHLKLPRR